MTAVRVGGGKSVNSSGTLRPSGKYVGEFDPALGLPATGSGKDGAILKGDFWKASGSGTIADLVPFTAFVTGDLIYANVNNASVVGDFFGNKGTGGSGVGDVVGPAGATGNDIALFDGITGKLLKGSGVIVSNEQVYVNKEEILIDDGTGNGWILSASERKLQSAFGFEGTGKANTYAVKGEDADGEDSGGGDLSLSGGDASSDVERAGNLVLQGGTNSGSAGNGFVRLPSLPTSSVGLPSGALWNDSGTIKIV